MENNQPVLSDIAPSVTETSFLQRLIANLLDFVIEISIIVIVVFLLSILLPEFFSINEYAKCIIVIAMMFAYRFLCIALFERTIGMMGLRLKYLNTKLQPLSGRQKLLAAFAIQTPGVKKYKQH